MAVTIKDISRQAEVSIATVSKVLNGDFSKVSDETRDRVLRVAKELDYRPNLMARSLVRKKSTLVGLIVPDISNPYFAEMCRSMSDECLRFGYNALISNTDEIHAREVNCIKSMAEYNVGGIILVGGRENAPENLELLTRLHVPFVGVENYCEGMEYCVYVDEFAGSHRAVEHLIRRGHTQIAYISGMPAGLEKHDVRLRGYRQALKDHELAANPYLVEHGGYNLDTGYKKTMLLLSRGIPFTAIACGNDMIALGAFKAIREHRPHIPQDISLVGYDDVYLSTAMEPRLTTVKQPAYEMGVYAVKVLLDRITKRTSEAKIKCFEPTLVERDTVSFRSKA